MNAHSTPFLIVSQIILSHLFLSDIISPKIYFKKPACFPKDDYGNPGRLITFPNLNDAIRTKVLCQENICRDLTAVAR
jgi:hypothetical protein